MFKYLCNSLLPEYNIMLKESFWPEANVEGRHYKTVLCSYKNTLWSHRNTRDGRVTRNTDTILVGLSSV